MKFITDNWVLIVIFVVVYILWRITKKTKNKWDDQIMNPIWEFMKTISPFRIFKKK